MSDQEKDLEERLKRLEEKTELTQKILGILAKFLDEKFPKEPITFCTDGPIMFYGKNSIKWSDLNIPDTEIKKEFKLPKRQNKKRC